VDSNLEKLYWKFPIEIDPEVPVKLFRILFCLLLLSPAWVQATEKGPETQATDKAAEKSADKVLDAATVSDQMADVWCGKLEECTTGKEMSSKECHKVLKKSFEDGFKNVPPGQKIEVKSSGLSQCSDSIKKNTCDSLKSAQTLPGCEFISQLNRS
jgi:hypothetical protein